MEKANVIKALELCGTGSETYNQCPRAKTRGYYYGLCIHQEKGVSHNESLLQRETETA